MLEVFRMPAANTCSKCGKIIVKGDECHAENQDEVLAGKAVCSSCAKPSKGKGKGKEVEVEVETEVEEVIEE